MREWAVDVNRGTVDALPAACRTWNEAAILSIKKSRKNEHALSDRLLETPLRGEIAALCPLMAITLPPGECIRKKCQLLNL